MKAVRKPNQAVRLIGVGVSGIGAPVRQLSLWDEGSEKSRKVQEVVDQLQEKYGRKITIRINNKDNIKEKLLRDKFNHKDNI